MAEKKRKDRLSRILDRIPEGPVGYGGNGKLAGMMGDVVRDTFESYSPTQPTDAEIVKSERLEDGKTRYIVNVTGWFEKVSEVRSMDEVLPGKINFPTDDVEIENLEVLDDRPLRKTHQVTLTTEPKIRPPPLRPVRKE